jgi:phospholipid/cholesterol/gamma-HCH transport system substrate-binding protein
MFPDRARAARVGLLVAVALAVLAGFVLTLSSRTSLFSGRTRYVARFSSIQGLAEGAEVRYIGVPVGTVESVELAPEPASSDVVVHLALRDHVASRIDGEVVAEIRTNGPLGDKLIELRRPAVPPGEPLPEGSEIATKAPPDIFGAGGDLLENVRSISASLDTITGRLVAGEGVVGRLLKDKEYGDRVLTDLEVTIAEVREIVDAAKDGRNLLGTLLSDERLATDVQGSIQRSLASLESISRRIERGEGALGQLTRDDSELSRAVSDLSVAAKNFRETSERVSKKEGLIYRLTADTEYGDAVAADLRSTLAHASSIARKIDEGEGSAGMLLNDPGVYTGVNDVVSGIERSWFVKLILRRKQKKGFEARVDRILKESPNPDRDLVELLQEYLDEGVVPPALPPARPHEAR